MKFLSVVTGCYNEEENVRELYERITRVFAEELPEYSFELILIDNCSQDKTVEVLRGICSEDTRVKVIVNNRNFGHIRSGYHAIFQARGDAIIAMASDLQDPPEMIPQFVRKWEAGYKIALAQKTTSEESALFFLVRKAYYHLVNRLSDVPLVKNVTGFGIYDRCVIEQIRQINDPYPYFRGLICDLGYEQALIPFNQPARKRGFTKNNLYTLYDMAMLGFVNHSKVPLRLAILSSFCVGAISFLFGFAYLVYKLLFWTTFQAGTAPVVVGLFFLGAVQLFFIGMIGEYVGAIHTQILCRPLVVEKERINFEALAPEPETAEAELARINRDATHQPR
ncbi:MAG TPA: glycosyltransferase family 2 protein [Terracidiphilus sp.]